MTPHDAMVKALREICAMAPACSAEAEGMNLSCGRSRGCDWRDTLREAQRIARKGLLDAGEKECP